MKVISIPVLLVVLFSFLFSESRGQCCTFTLSMHDSYGDGWNGAYLEVYINNTLIGTYNGTGSQSSESFDICNGDALELIYTPGEYENENSYQLYDVGWNLLFNDGPDPQTGSVFSTNGNCDVETIPGGSPCTAVPLVLGECVLGDNGVFDGSGLNPGCAAYNGSDVWYSLVVPASGNLSFQTANGGLTDTGVAVWTGNDCTNLTAIGCDDDSGNDYYSFLLMYDLNPGEMLYVQVFGYGGSTGFFDLCSADLGTVTLEYSELPIVMINTLGQTIVTENKIDAIMDIKYNGPGNLTYISDPSNEYSGNIGIEIRGATSAGYPQRPYGIETRTELGGNNNVSILGMPAENDWVLLSNYNDLSLIRNTLAFKLFGEMGNYGVRTSLCEVLVDSSYKGIYVFGEKIKRDSNRVDIASLTPFDNEGDAVTGGYMLQQNYWDNNNSFESNYSPIDHPDFDVHFVYEYPKVDSITESQKDYIASFMDTLETALYGSDFMDSTSGYRNYLNVNSFIDYFLVNELARSNDGFKKSVFYYKEKNIDGGKLKAGPVWDFDWAWKNLATCSIFENTDGSGWAHLINDCPTDNYSTGWYLRLMQDSTYNNQLRCKYEEYRETILDTTYLFSYIDSVRALVQNAQARHFQKWPILGVSGQAPEIGDIATTYNEELDKLKEWISLRLIWLDENIPGYCAPEIVGVAEQKMSGPISYFPNPSDGVFHFAGIPGNISSVKMIVYNVAGKVVDQLWLEDGATSFDFYLMDPGVYYFSISGGHGNIQHGKLIVL